MHQTCKKKNYTLKNGNRLHGETVAIYFPDLIFTKKLLLSVKVSQHWWQHLKLTHHNCWIKEKYRKKNKLAEAGSGNSFQSQFCVSFEIQSDLNRRSHSSECLQLRGASEPTVSRLLTVRPQSLAAWAEPVRPSRYRAHLPHAEISGCNRDTPIFHCAHHRLAGTWLQTPVLALNTAQQMWCSRLSAFRGYL